MGGSKLEYYFGGGIDSHRYMQMGVSVEFRGLLPLLIVPLIIGVIRVDAKNMLILRQVN